MRAGDELATVESVELETLQSQLLNNEIELTLLRRVLERRTSLEASQAITATQLLETQSELANKELEQEIVRLKLMGWGLTSESIATVLATKEPVRTISIVSPLSGIVDQVAAAVHDMTRSQPRPTGYRRGQPLASGSTIRNRVPSPGVDSTSTRPPCARTMVSTSASPSPAPGTSEAWAWWVR